MNKKSCFLLLIPHPSSFIPSFIPHPSALILSFLPVHSLLEALLSALIILSIPSFPALAQTTHAEQLKKAVERSENAASAITTISGLADNGIPIELVEKAEAIAVFPHVVKAKMLFQQMTLGFGVVSQRLPGGWSPPAYYSFGGGGLGLSSVGGETADVIMLFMNKQAVAWFQKGRFELKGDKKAIGGPVGKVKNDPRSDDVAGANIIVYTLDEGRLSGHDITSHFFRSFVINPDNKLNKAVYKMKSRDVLSGKPIDSQSVPVGIDAFQQALTRYSSRK